MKNFLLAPPFTQVLEFIPVHQKTSQSDTLDFNFLSTFSGLFHLVHSLYLASFSLGMMFMDCSSWNKSLQA